MDCIIVVIMCTKRLYLTCVKKSVCVHSATREPLTQVSGEGEPPFSVGLCEIFRSADR